MNRMLIVGNGFDLEHDLKTTYWDFREYLEENHLDFLIIFSVKKNTYTLKIAKELAKAVTALPSTCVLPI